MPVQRCTKDGKPGYRWGATGSCYTYSPGNGPAQQTAIAKAQRQGVAARSSGYEAVQDPTAAQRSNLPAAAYAAAFMSGDDFKPSKSKLPHHVNTVTDGNSNTTVDVPRLRNALARFDQVDWAGFPGGEKARSRAHLERHADAILYGNEDVCPCTPDDKAGLRLDLTDFRNLDFASIRARHSQQ